MKVEKDINTFGGKLYRLFLEKGYDLEPQNSHALRSIEKDMLEKGLITSDYDLRSQLSKDVKLSVPYPDISTSTLRMYCEFLGCSADFLLGFIDYPTHSLTDINKATGLAPESIKTLLFIEKMNCSELLDYLLSKEDGLYFISLLNACSIYISDNIKDVSIFDFKENKSIHVPKKSVLNVETDKTTLRTLVYNKIELEKNAMVQIEGILRNIRDNLSCDKSAKKV